MFAPTGKYFGHHLQKSASGPPWKKSPMPMVPGKISKVSPAGCTYMQAVQRSSQDKVV